MRRLLACLLLVAAPLAAQERDPLSAAALAERRGDLATALARYREALVQRPGDVTAVLGVERVLGSLGRPLEFLPLVQAALAARPTAVPVLGAALRAYVRADRADSARGVVQRWAALDSTDEAPWREWGQAAQAQRDRATARAAYLEGRQRAGRPDALAPELAQLAVTEGDWPAAAREWLLAVRRIPAYRGTAAGQLALTPEAQRPELRAQLERDADPEARRLAAELVARWGDPRAGAALLRAALPADRAAAVEALRQFLEVLRGRTGPDARQAQGETLEALAARVPPGQGARLRLEAAQAFAGAGDRAAARRLLEAIASDAGAPAGLAGEAATTLIGVLVDEGKPAEAATMLAALGTALAAEDREALGRRVALGWAWVGAFDRADSLVQRDSTVEGFALAGRLRLYRGDIGGAITYFQQAGPYAGGREEATARTRLYPLLQPIEADSLPELGRGLLHLDRGDTVAALPLLEGLAGRLEPAKGGAELGLLLARIARARGELAEAEARIRRVVAEAVPATAPTAELELARILLVLGRQPEAVAQFEHLILTHPASAVVPQARRELDEARGMIPRT